MFTGTVIFAVNFFADTKMSQVRSNFVCVRYMKFWIENFKFNMNISIELDLRIYEQKPGEPFGSSRLESMCDGRQHEFRKSTIIIELYMHECEFFYCQ